MGGEVYDRKQVENMVGEGGEGLGRPCVKTCNPQRVASSRCEGCSCGLLVCILLIGPLRYADSSSQAMHLLAQWPGIGLLQAVCHDLYNRNC